MHAAMKLPHHCYESGWTAKHGHDFPEPITKACVMCRKLSCLLEITGILTELKFAASIYVVHRISKDFDRQWTVMFYRFISKLCKILKLQCTRIYLAIVASF